jgi:SET domain-containing protein
VLNTNSFQCGELDLVDRRISRFNHSCKPNCAILFGNLADIRVIVVEGIQSGEEMTIHYLPLDWASLGPSPPRTGAPEGSQGRLGIRLHVPALRAANCHLSRTRSSSVKTNVANDAGNAAQAARKFCHVLCQGLGH